MAFLGPLGPTPRAPARPRTSLALPANTFARGTLFFHAYRRHPSSLEICLMVCYKLPIHLLHSILAALEGLGTNCTLSDDQRDTWHSGGPDMPVE